MSDDPIEIIDRVLPWSGSEEDLVAAGEGEAVKRYLAHIADGGQA